jgi:hypothetical protein
VLMLKIEKESGKKIHFNIFSSEKLFWKTPFTTISNTNTLPPELYSFSMNFRTLMLYLCKYEPQRMCHAIWTWHLVLDLCSMNLKSFQAWYIEWNNQRLCFLFLSQEKLWSPEPR